MRGYASFPKVNRPEISLTMVPSTRSRPIVNPAVADKFVRRGDDDWACIFLWVQQLEERLGFRGLDEEVVGSEPNY
eukprot:CAMPEP_0170191324 /NCGR_PEP_ID=MMETSP0040_2-20121228/51464_1 /TAXON_ID=641309 /ORGANISM="Lotharella oceanica, Strain CCMP622" /LENGTH=75 /DNA_ID=CAMNT_0010439387 /DNA_START=38 /DNA_END=265 /DNA_ORIENTATION=+